MHSYNILQHINMYMQKCHKISAMADKQIQMNSVMNWRLEWLCIERINGVVIHLENDSSTQFHRWSLTQQVNTHQSCHVHMSARNINTSCANTSTPPTRRSTLGDRSFPVAAARAWNALPQHVRNAPDLPVFRRELKTVLFRSSFPDATWQFTVLYLYARRSLLMCTGCHKLFLLWHLYGGPAAYTAIVPP